VFPEGPPRAAAPRLMYVSLAMVRPPTETATSSSQERSAVVRSACNALFGREAGRQAGLAGA
jgi:hypothetical protein